MKGIEHIAARKIHAERVLAVRVDVARQRDARVGNIGLGKLLDWIGDQIFERYAGIGDLVHERRVGAVLQQPAHQVRQEVGKAADRRVHTYREVRMLGQKRFVKRVPHSQKLLEFKFRFF